MRWPLTVWVLWTSGLGLLDRVRGSGLQTDVGQNQARWRNWEPWICLCRLRKQARIRHYVAWAAGVTPELGPNAFWEEKPCSRRECLSCRPEECPDSLARSDSESFLPTNPHDSEIPLLPLLDSDSYDNLPVVDDTGQG